MENSLNDIFIELVEKAAGARPDREESIFEIVRVLKAKADRWDAHVAEARRAPLRRIAVGGVK